MKTYKSWLLAATVALQAQAGEPQTPSGEIGLGEAIARQGDAALVQIRKESTRLAPPALPPRPETAGAAHDAADLAALEQARTRAKLAALRRDVYSARPEREPTAP
jgi:hypothetical protein